MFTNRCDFLGTIVHHAKAIRHVWANGSVSMVSVEQFELLDIMVAKQVLGRCRSLVLDIGPMPSTHIQTTLKWKSPFTSLECTLIDVSYDRGINLNVHEFCASRTRMKHHLSYIPNLY